MAARPIIAPAIPVSRRRCAIDRRTQQRSPFPITGIETAARNLTNYIPIGRTGITLSAGPTVHGQRSDSGVGENFARRERR